MDNELFSDYPDILSVKDVAKMLNVGLNTTYSLLKEKKIKNFLIGNKYRITKSAVIEYIRIYTEATICTDTN